MRECVQGLLVREPASRLTANQALEHPWIKDQRSAPSKSLNGSVVRLNTSHTSASQLSVLACLCKLDICACLPAINLNQHSASYLAPQWQRGEEGHISFTKC